MTRSESHDPYRLQVAVTAVLFVVTIPAMMAAAVALRPDPPVDPFTADARTLGIRAQDLHRGQSIYERTCAACHGVDGTGIPALGKPLRNSAYVQAHAHEELLTLIVEGRLPHDSLNTTGIAMPPRAARDLADDQIEDVIFYLRTLQDPDAPVADMHPWMTRPIPRPVVADASQTSDDVGGVSAPAGGAPPTGASAGPSSAERAMFVAACSSCHGPSGEGIANLGKPLAASAFVQGKTDAELIAFIKTGRPLWDAENTTGLDMPPKGGNPALSDDDIGMIVSFIRSLQEDG